MNISGNDGDNQIEGGTDGTIIGNVGDKLKVTGELVSGDITIVGGCPTIAGTKWRSEMDTTDINLSTTSFTTLKTLSSGILESLAIEFSTDKLDLKINIDGTDIFTINLDDLEELQVGNSSAAPSGGIMSVKTGSKFSFTPRCGLTYNTLTISAQAEQSNKKMENLLIHYVDMS